MNKQKIADNIVNYGLPALLLLMVLAYPIMAYTSVDTYENVKIKDKERITTQEGSYYLIYTDKGVFANEDSILYVKFNSSNIYNQLERGSTCKIEANWFRFTVFSWYENIITADCQKPE